MEILEECIENGFLAMNGCIYMVFCSRWILFEELVSMLVGVLAGIYEVGVFKLFKFYNGGVRKTEL